MQQPENTKCSLEIYCRFFSKQAPAFNGELICGTTEYEPLAGQIFYILDRSAEELLKKHKDIIWLYPPEGPDFCYPDADKILGGHINEILNGADVDPHKYLLALMHVAALSSDITR